MKEYMKYVEDVKSGKIKASSYIKMAVARFEKFLARPDIYLDEEAVQECIDFIAQMRHFEGKSVGMPFILLPWQQFVVANIIGLKWKATNTRVCRETYIQVARKAGKDSLIAAISLYMMIADGEAAPQIACLANSREQAKILFRFIEKYARSVDAKGEIIDFYKQYLTTEFNNGSVKVYSADASKLDGLNISLGVIDEYHEAKSRDLYDVMKSSQTMRSQPLMVIITTAGFNLESPCYIMYQLGIEILSGVKNDDTFFPFIFCLDADDDWTDEENWIKCQPNLGVTVTYEAMRAEMQKAKNDSTAEVSVKTKTFNIWCSHEMTWIKPEVIVKSMQDVDISDYENYTCYMGVDLGSVDDFTSVSVMIPVNAHKFVFKTWTFIPYESYKNHSNKELYDRFLKEGSLITTPGNVCDYDYILNKIGDINKILNIEGIYYDQWNSTSWAIKATDLGYNMQPYSQAIGNFNNPTKEFERLIKSEEVVVDKSANVLWQFGNVTLKMDHNGNCLDINTDVPTPNGFVKMKDLEIGDYVFGYDGKPVRVIDTTPIIENRDCYKLIFNNGAEVISDAGHQWYVNYSSTKNGKSFNTWGKKTTEWLYEHYINKQGNCCRHTILTQPVEYTEKDYTIDPYILGLWLGDGTSSCAQFTVSTGDTQMYDYVKTVYGEPSVQYDKRDGRDGYISLTFTGKTLYRQLVQLNLLKNKHIPEEYLYGSVEQRLALLQGLMDTDGTCNKYNQQCSIVQKRRIIIEGVVKLLDSLGIRHSKITGDEYYHLSFYTKIPVFKLNRKLRKQQQYTPTPLQKYNSIVSIEKTESVPVKCITVDNPEHLFLVTDKYLVTGNCKPAKDSYKKKIDSVISMLTALGGYLKNPLPDDFEIFVI